MPLPTPTTLLALLCLLPAAALQAAPPGNGWALAWSDEFAGSSLDTANWNVGTGARRDATNTASALTVANGYLRVKTYTEGGKHYTGWIGSNGKFENAFGYWEARIRCHSSQGMWSAFWLQPYGINNVGDPAGNGTEIDIMEHRSRDSGGADLRDRSAINIHWDGYGADHKSVGATVANPGANPASLQGNFHTYGLLWEPGRYRFYIDGVEVWTTTAAISNVRQWIYLTSEVENGAWAGPVPASYGDRSTSATWFDVDHVRFYQRAEQTINGSFANRMGPWRQLGTSSLSATGGRDAGPGARMNPANTSGGSVEQTVAGLLPNTPYILRGWGNVGDRYWPNLRIGVKNHGFPDAYASVASNGFTEARHRFTTGPANDRATVFASMPTQYGDAYADDLVLSRAGRFTNGGFELGDTTHWSFYGDSFVHDWTPAYVRSGLQAMRLNGNTAARGAEQTIHGLKPATTYRLSCWLKGGGQAVRIGAKNHGAAEAFTTRTTSGLTWLKGSHSFTTGAAGTSATVYAYAPAGSNAGAVDLDDFLLLEDLPAAWTSSKIGAGHPGEAGLADGRIVVRGSGNNLGGTADGLQFVHRPLSGSGAITARLDSFEAAHNRAKAGVAIRASTAADAPFAMVHWLPDGQVEFIWRNSAGAAASYVWAAVPTAWPPWLRLTRDGSRVTAWFSTDGSAWTQAGVPQTIDLPATPLAGLAVTSHETGDSGDAVFSEVVLTGGFAGWAEGEGLSGGDALPGADPDGDGIVNSLEYLLRGDPELADRPILPGGQKSGANFVFTFTRDKAAAAELGMVVEYSADLASPAWSVATAGMLQLADHGATETVTVTIPAASPRLFVRLRTP